MGITVPAVGTCAGNTGGPAVGITVPAVGITGAAVGITGPAVGKAKCGKAKLALICTIVVVVVVVVVLATR